MMGDQVTLLALPLAALSLGASLGQVALLAAATRAPFLVLALPAGVWVKRIGIRRSMLFSEVLRGTALASLPVAAWVGAASFEQLLIVAVALGTGSVTFLVAYQSLTPLIVEDATMLRSANARLTGAEVIAAIGGPAVAGFLVAALGALRALTADALSYVISFVTIYRLRVPADVGASTDESLSAHIAGGLSYVLHQPVLRAVLFASVLFNAGQAGYEALLAAFVVGYLGLSPAQLGLAVGIAGIGVPLGLFLSGRIERRIGTGPLLALSAGMSAAGLLIAASSQGSTALVTICLGTLVTGVGGGAWTLTALTTRQVLSSAGMRPMTNAVHRWATYGVLPLGALGAAAVASAAGYRPGMLVAAESPSSPRSPYW